jgi:hypothetical protein
MDIPYHPLSSESIECIVLVQVDVNAAFDMWLGIHNKPYAKEPLVSHIQLWYLLRLSIKHYISHDASGQEMHYRIPLFCRRTP